MFYIRQTQVSAEESTGAELPPGANKEFSNVAFSSAKRTKPREASFAPEMVLQMKMLSRKREPSCFRGAINR